MSWNLEWAPQTGLASGKTPPRNAFALFSFAWVCTLLLGFVLVLAASDAHANSAADGTAVDLNQATLSQLEALPGIGAIKAAAILAVREERGGFRSADDLESVRGIGKALVEKLRPLVRVGSGKAVNGQSGRIGAESAVKAKPAKPKKRGTK